MEELEVGQMVKVVKEVNGHQFKMGDWVKVYKIKPEFVVCTSLTGKQFGLTAEEFETV